MKNIFTAMTALYCFMQTTFNLHAQDKGPAYIKNTLRSDAVFERPTFSFTTDYDAYKEYSNIKGLFIDALDYNGHSTKVFCWYGVPETLGSGEKAPAVVLVHGGGGTAFPDWVKKWTDRGYIAIAIAHEGQLPGAKNPLTWYPTWKFSGPRRDGFFKDADKDVREQWFYHAVADAILANSLLRSFPEVDRKNIGINGISWGGILTNVITGIDERFKFSIPVYGCGYLYDSAKYSRDILLNSEAENQFYLDNWEPSLYIPRQSLPVFYVNGNNDRQFSMNIATPSYNLIPSEKYLRIENLMAHSVPAGYAPEEIYKFADYITGTGKAPMTVSIDNVIGSNVTASYQGNAKSAVLYYTTDAKDWKQDTYVWEEIAVQLFVKTKKIRAELPGNTKYFYINTTSNNDLMYSSPMNKINAPSGFNITGDGRPVWSDNLKLENAMLNEEYSITLSFGSEYYDFDSNPNELSITVANVGRINWFTLEQTTTQQWTLRGTPGTDDIGLNDIKFVLNDGTTNQKNVRVPLFVEGIVLNKSKRIPDSNSISITSGEINENSGISFKIRATVKPLNDSHSIGIVGSNYWGVTSGGDPTTAANKRFGASSDLEQAKIYKLEVVDFDPGTTGYSASVITDLHFQGLQFLDADGSTKNPKITLSEIEPKHFFPGPLAEDDQYIRFGLEFETKDGVMTIGSKDDRVTTIVLTAAINSGEWKIGLTDVGYTYTEPSLSVDDLISASFKLYPNPVRDNVLLNMTIYSATILNVAGKVVKGYSEGTKKLDVSDLASGVYILRGVSKEGAPLRQKFVK